MTRIPDSCDSEGGGDDSQDVSPDYHSANGGGNSCGSCSDNGHEPEEQGKTANDQLADGQASHLLLTPEKCWQRCHLTLLPLIEGHGLGADWLLNWPRSNR